MRGEEGMGGREERGAETRIAILLYDFVSMIIMIIVQISL